LVSPGIGHFHNPNVVRRPQRTVRQQSGIGKPLEKRLWHGL